MFNDDATVNKDSSDAKYASGESLHRYKALVEYDGGGFAGWQIQSGDRRDIPTVQGVIEEAFRRYCGEDIRVYAAGRTDTGVHARGQVIHFGLGKVRSPHEIAMAVNFHCRPHKVAIRDVEEVDKDFHARFSAKQRCYRYVIHNRPYPSPLRGPYTWHVPIALDIEHMHRAAQVLVGTHDFTSFRSVHCSAESAVRTIDSIEVRGHREAPELVVIHVTARSFLHNQVRIIVGHLYMVGVGKLSREDLVSILAAKDRTKGALTAPAHGLCLQKIVY